METSLFIASVIDPIAEATRPQIFDRHPEVAASSAALEGRRPGCILRGSQGLAPQDDDHRATLAK